MAKKQKQKTTPYGSIPRPGQWQYVTTRVLSTQTKPEEVSSNMKGNSFTPSRIRNNLKDAQDQDALIEGVTKLNFNQPLSGSGGFTLTRDAGLLSPFKEVDKPRKPFEFTKKGMVTIGTGNFMPKLSAGPRVGSLAADDEAIEPPNSEDDELPPMGSEDEDMTIADLHVRRGSKPPSPEPEPKRSAKAVWDLSEFDNDDLEDMIATDRRSKRTSALPRISAMEAELSRRKRGGKKVASKKTSS